MPVAPCPAIPGPVVPGLGKAFVGKALAGNPLEETPVPCVPADDPRLEPVVAVLNPEEPFSGPLLPNKLFCWACALWAVTIAVRQMAIAPAPNDRMVERVMDWSLPAPRISFLSISPGPVRTISIQNIRHSLSCEPIGILAISLLRVRHAGAIHPRGDVAFHEVPLRRIRRDLHRTRVRTK